MIHYMPFTYLSDRLIGRVVSAVGSIAVCQTVEALLPANMQHWIQKGAICPVYPVGLNPDQLLKAIDEFNHWGQIHEGRLAAMAGASLSDQSRHPLTDEQAPTRLRDLIRQYKNRPDDTRPDTQFRAALFLAMAQIYDEQQETVSGTLAGVQQMEMEMTSQLAGDLDSLPEPHSGVIPERVAADQDRGLQLTDQRIEAWAVLASGAEIAPHLYLTTSAAVFSALMERLPEAVRIDNWRLPFNKLDSQSVMIPGKGRFGVAVETMAAAADPLSVAMDSVMGDQNDDGVAVVTMAVLPGRKPSQVLEALARGDEAGRKPLQVLSDLAWGEAPGQMAAGEVCNTVFGHLAIGD